MPTVMIDRRIRVGAIAILATLVFMLTVMPASGHDELVGSQPSDGQVLADPPQAIVLRFAEAPMPAGLAVVVTGSDGVHHDLDARVKGDSVVAAWPGYLGPGGYTVAYRVVSEDGHPVSGRFVFTIEAPADTEATPTASPSTGPTDSPSTTTVASPADTSPAASGSPSASPQPATISGSPPAWALPVALLGFVVTGAGAWAYIKHASREDESGTLN